MTEAVCGVAVINPRGLAVQRPWFSEIVVDIVFVLISSVVAAWCNCM